jgi:hypothetical protein
MKKIATALTAANQASIWPRMKRSPTIIFAKRRRRRSRETARARV